MADKKKSPARETVKELRELSVEELSTKLARNSLTPALSMPPLSSRKRASSRP